jgi:heme-degrading monooxygenase HmoA
MFVSVTRLRVRRFIYLPQFLWRTQLAKGQATKAPGFLGGRLLVDAHRAYWTLTVWENDAAMKAYRGSGAHAGVMRKLAEWCDEAAYAHWESADATVPTWPEAYEHLVNSGKLSRVSHPSAAHEARQFPEPRLRPMIGQQLKAKNR